MFGELFKQVLLMILGAVVPIVVTKGSEKLEVLGDWRPSPQTVKITVISSVVSLFLSLFFLGAYDRGWVPFTKEAEIRHDKFDFGKSVHNDTGGTLLVTVVFFNSVREPANIVGNTVCAAVAPDPGALPHFTPGNCTDPTTVTEISFNVGNRQVPLTFVVPRGWWFNVITDGGTVAQSFWTETVLR
jgi:hypothetical protein